MSNREIALRPKELEVGAKEKQLGLIV